MKELSDIVKNNVRKLCKPDHNIEVKRRYDGTKMRLSVHFDTNTGQIWAGTLHSGIGNVMLDVDTDNNVTLHHYLDDTVPAQKIMKQSIELYEQMLQCQKLKREIYGE